MFVVAIGRFGRNKNYNYRRLLKRKGRKEKMLNVSKIIMRIKVKRHTNDMHSIKLIQNVAVSLQNSLYK